MEKLKLTEEEKTELKEFHKGIRDKRSGDRIKAILMLNDGYSFVEIATVLLVEEKTIRRWQCRYKARKNITSYIFNDCQGYEGKLSKRETGIVSGSVKTKGPRI